MGKIRNLLLFSFFCLISCKKENFIVLNSTHDTIEIKRIVLRRHKNPKGYVENYYIQLKDYTSIKDRFIPEFKIILGDSIYTAQGIALAYSREKITKDFFYFYDNKSKLICKRNIDGEEMINISQRYSDHDVLNWVKTELIID